MIPLADATEAITYDDYIAAAKTYGLDPTSLYAVSILESKMTVNGMCAPYPWTLNYDNKSYYYQDYKSAKKGLEEFMRQPGLSKPDVGLFQVSLRYHRQDVGKASDLLDPKTNILVGAKILAEAVHSTDDKILGYGRYHTWNPRREKEARIYGKKVMALADLIKIWRSEQWMTKP